MVRLFVFSLLLVAVFAAYESNENRRHGNQIENENHKIEKSTKTHENAEEDNNNSNSSSNEELTEQTTTGDDTESTTSDSNSESDSSADSDSSGTVETEEVIDRNSNGRNTYEVEETVNESPCAIMGFQNGCICRVGDIRCINIHQGLFSFD